MHTMELLDKAIGSLEPGWAYTLNPDHLATDIVVTLWKKTQQLRNGAPVVCLVGTFLEARLWTQEIRDLVKDDPDLGGGVVEQETRKGVLPGKGQLAVLSYYGFLSQVVGFGQQIPILSAGSRAVVIAQQLFTATLASEMAVAVLASSFRAAKLLIVGLSRTADHLQFLERHLGSAVFASASIADADPQEPNTLHIPEEQVSGLITQILSAGENVLVFEDKPDLPLAPFCRLTRDETLDDLDVGEGEAGRYYSVHPTLLSTPAKLPSFGAVFSRSTTYRELAHVSQCGIQAFVVRRLSKQHVHYHARLCGTDGHLMTVFTDTERQAFPNAPEQSGDVFHGKVMLAALLLSAHMGGNTSLNQVALRNMHHADNMRLIYRQWKHLEFLGTLSPMAHPPTLTIPTIARDRTHWLRLSMRLNVVSAGPASVLAALLQQRNTGQPSPLDTDEMLGDLVLVLIVSQSLDQLLLEESWTALSPDQLREIAAMGQKEGYACWSLVKSGTLFAAVVLFQLALRMRNLGSAEDQTFVQVKGHKISCDYIRGIQLSCAALCHHMNVPNVLESKHDKQCDPRIFLHLGQALADKLVVVSSRAKDTFHAEHLSTHTRVDVSKFQHLLVAISTRKTYPLVFFMSSCDWVGDVLVPLDLTAAENNAHRVLRGLMPDKDIDEQAAADYLDRRMAL